MNFELGFYKYYYENSLNIGFFHGKELIDGKEFLNVYNFEIFENDSNSIVDNNKYVRIEYLPLLTLNKTKLLKIENNINLQQEKVVIIYASLFISGHYQYRDGMKNIYGLYKEINLFGFIRDDLKNKFDAILKNQDYEYRFR